MIEKGLRSLLLLLLLSPLSPACGGDAPMAVYELKLFNYQLGMSYDEAISVRAFHYTRYEEENVAVGIVNGAYIEEVEFNTAAYFSGDRLFKIIGRFDPDHFEQVEKSLVRALGRGNASPKAFHSVNGTKVTGIHHKWVFPGAEIHLLSYSNNTDFATLSMIATGNSKNEQEDEEPTEVTDRSN
ncbi:MAG: hypothetical protein P8X63_00855 [Desulfuromonadaceae bacterium]